VLFGGFFKEASMKAAVLTGAKHIELQEVPEPEFPEGGVIIQVETCAICGTDVKMHQYGYAGAELPLIPGHELAGVVARSNALELGFKVGDRVTVNPNIPCGVCYFCRRGLQTACDNLRIIGVHRHGGFARFVMIPEHAITQGCVFHLPGSVSFEEAALLDPVSCAVNASEISGTGPGDTVVVIGAGPAGCLNVEVSRAVGARKTMLVQRSPGRLRQAAFTDTDVMIDSSQEDPVQRVLEETDGRGADVVIVACASGEAQQQALQMVAKRGNVNLFGGLPKGSPSIQFDSNLVHYRESTVTGTHGGSNRHCAIALDMIASGRVKAAQYVSFRYPLSKFSDAIEAAEKKRGLKVFVEPGSY
jgi:L-iditol 2-dehydrogenase